MHTCVHTSECSWSLAAPKKKQGKWYINIIACSDIAAGEELFLSYRSGESNDAFCLHYGFLPRLNPHDSVVLFGDLSEALAWHCREFAVKVSSALAR